MIGRAPVVLYDVGGGTETSLDPRDHLALIGVGMISLIPHEIGGVQSNELIGKLPAWQYEIPAEIDRAVPARAPLVFDTPRIATWDPMSAQRAVVLVDIAGGLPVPPADPVVGAGYGGIVSPLEQMVRAVGG